MTHLSYDISYRTRRGTRGVRQSVQDLLTSYELVTLEGRGSTLLTLRTGRGHHVDRRLDHK